MSGDASIRWGWLKGMYIYTIVMAGGFGLGVIVIPNVIISAFGFPSQDPITLGIVGSVYVAFGLLSILGLRSPLKFVPLLLLQLCYKSIWFLGVLLPILITGRFSAYAIMYIVIFTTYIVGDVIAIPFSYIFAKKTS